jgi:hypothetical protein
MIDKNHVKINKKDLDEILFKYYDFKKLLNIKNKNLRKTEEFKILFLRAKVAKKLKEKNINNNDEWEEINENFDDFDFEPIELPNGELLLENGEKLGNKIYNIYYKQRIKINPYENVIKEFGKRKKLIRKKMRKINAGRKMRMRCVNYKVIKGSNKSNFERINTLNVMRSQFGLV